MDIKILCVMTLLNFAMLLANIWLWFDSAETLEEIKERSGFYEDS